MVTKLRSVMIQLRDDQIERLDGEATARGASRSKVLRDAVDRAFDTSADSDLSSRYASAYPLVSESGTSQGPSWAELWWCRTPPGGRRPVVVLTRPEAAARLPRLLVAGATDTARGLPSEVTLGPDDGLDAEIVIDLDQPESVDRTRLESYIATLSAHRWQQIAAALRQAVNG